MLEVKCLHKSTMESKRHAVMDMRCVGGNTFQSYATLEHVSSGPGSIFSSYGMRKERGVLGDWEGMENVIVISMYWVVLVGAYRCSPVSWKLYSLSFNYGFILQVQMHKTCLTVFMKLNMGYAFTGQQSSTIKSITTFVGLHFVTLSIFDSVASECISLILVVLHTIIEC